jgi:hypothetical protein
MKRMVVALGMLVIGCGNTECEDAKERAEDCGGAAAVGAKQVSDEEAADCDPKDECAAKCVNKTSCAEINAGDADFLACVTACG